jgi:hypothetical protein
MTERTIELVLVCHDAPPLEYDNRPCEFGLQDTNHVLHPGEQMPDGALRFSCEAMVKRRKDGTPDLGGRFVHGPGGGRFLYLGWRVIGGATWIRRYKIPLAPLSWGLLETSTLHASVSTAGRSVTLTFRAPWASLPH